MGKQSDAAKLLAIGLLNVADDEGYFYADAKLIRNSIRAFDDDSGITTVAIRELSETGYLSIKNHPTHGAIGFIESFANHQVINKPKRSIIKDLYESGSDTVSIPDKERLEGKGMERNGTGKGKDSLSASADEEYPEIIKTLWKIFPQRSRGRSSKALVAKEWSKIRAKPLEQIVITSLTKWAACYDWTKEGGQYAPGAHLWIQERKWEDDPAPAPAPFARDQTSRPKFAGMQEDLEIPDA